MITLPLRTPYLAPVMASALVMTTLLAPGHHHAAAQQAPASPLLAARHAVATVRRYQSDLVTSFTSNGTLMTMDQRLIVTRATTNRPFYDLILSGRVKGKTTGVSETVVEGARECGRASLTAPFRCRIIDAAAAAQFRWTVASMVVTSLPSPGSITGVVPSRLITGRRCDGYTLAVPLHDRARFTLYIERGTHLPCAFVGQSGGMSASTTWTRYNDPTLAMPRLP